MSDQTLKKTVLFHMHQLCGARFSPFNGWQMPLHYGSQIKEHHAVRQRTGLFDVSHMACLDIRGQEAEHFMRFVFSNDTHTLDYGRAAYGCLLNQAGGIIDDLIVYKVAPHLFRVVVNAGRALIDREWLTERISSFDCTLHSCTNLAVLSLQGPDSIHVLQKIRHPFFSTAASVLQTFCCMASEPYFLARTGYTGEDGFELILPAEEAEQLWRGLVEEQNVQPCGLGARDTLRLEAGLNLYGQDMDETITPYECGIGWTVNKKDSERLFIGKEALEQSTPRFKRIGIVLQTPGVLRSHQEITGDHGTGLITSGGFSPTLNKGIGMARVPRPYEALQSVTLTIRQKSEKAMLYQLPFVKHGKILVMNEQF